MLSKSYDWVLETDKCILGTHKALGFWGARIAHERTLCSSALLIWKSFSIWSMIRLLLIVSTAHFLYCCIVFNGSPSPVSFGFGKQPKSALELDLASNWNFLNDLALLLSKSLGSNIRFESQSQLNILCCALYHCWRRSCEFFRFFSLITSREGRKVHSISENV